MNAVEFVKKYGWEESQYISSLIMETGENVYGVEREDLHRLVESYELVEKFGGLDNAKQEECMANYFGFGHNGLKQAIIDVESCL